MKKAIVTGGAGFIGSHMVDLLLKKGFSVTMLDNFSGGHKKNIKQHQKNRKFKIIKIDIRKLKPNASFFKSVDYVFHFAGIGDIVPSIDKPAEYMDVNVQGTIKVLEASRINNVKKFVYAASASCYGLNESRITEKDPIKLEHPYALSKYLGERSVLHWHKVYKLPINVIRIFNAYGPRVRTTGAYGAVFGVFFKQYLSNKPLTIVGDGNQSRDFVFVSDVVNAFYRAATTKFVGEIFNVGTGNPTSIKQLANLIGGKTISLPDRPGEPRKSEANINKIISKLNWKPKISFNQGVKIMLKNIQDWNNAPLWTEKKIINATKKWFKTLQKNETKKNS